ncbi:MAG: DoxX family protein [Bacteroidales bacterium]|nr:DoxX family protein [Bacteroidales bacterium]MBN2756265.1 DoxX family protein [Bacteroidales bacterium]
MKILKKTSRIIIGMVFTFSGIVKAIDPVGSQIKFTDYFNAFGLSSLGLIALTLAVILSALEFLVGVCLLFNVKPKLASFGALIFMIIFTPLTLYIAIADPVSDCGCFGDALIITNWQTFWKNIILIVLAVFLFIEIKKEKLVNNLKFDYSFIALSTIFIFWFQIFNIRHLPVIDFRPYSEGTFIPDKMKTPENAKKDSTITYLYYQKNGETKKFYIDDIPWQDTSWKWVKTETKIIEKGYVPPIHDFSMFSFDIYSKEQDGSINILNEVLADTSYSFLIISHDLVENRFTDYEAIKIIKKNSVKYKYQMYFLTSSTAQDIKLFNKLLNLNIKFYVTDGLTLQTIIRSNPGLVLLKQGKIIRKWHKNDFPTMEEVEEIIKK